MDSAFTVPNQLKSEIRNQVAQSPIPIALSDEQQREYISLIKQQLKKQNAVLIVHYYVNEQLQILADETGGCVADSLGMAQFGARHPASTLVVVGVRFMGETAKILNPEKRVLMPDLAATCSLDLSCPAEDFHAYCREHPQRTVVVYANTSAAVKAGAHWVVTSSNAVDIIKHLQQQGKKFIWAPDKHLGRYLQQQTGADMLIWQGYCVVHDEFNAQALQQLINEHPQAEVLVHPESPLDVIALADVVGSTTKLIKAARQSTADTLIVATDYGIFHKMNQAAPGKKLLLAPALGAGPSCTVCAHCPWMARNNLVNLADTLSNGRHEILVEESIRQKALRPIQRMLAFPHEQTHQTPAYA